MAGRWFILSVAIASHVCQETSSSRSLPLVLSSHRRGVSGSCPSSEATRDDIQEQVLSLINNAQQNQPPCSCGGSGLWTRIAHLNMSDSSQECPPNWNLTTTPVRGCGRSSLPGDTCDSAIFSSTGLPYSRVCGKVIAYQHGSPDAFDPTVRGFFANNPNPGVEGAYVDGVSLTHGAAGSRQHIWTFAAALWENDTHFFDYSFFSCDCTNASLNWPFHLPSFIGNNYFCDTGNPGPGFNATILYQDDPLWDGEGCGPSSTCCQFNSPPWFCTTLPQATSDDIELRICLDQLFGDEDVIVNLVDIYIM